MAWEYLTGQQPGSSWEDLFSQEERDPLLDKSGAVVNNSLPWSDSQPATGDINNYRYTGTLPTLGSNAPNWLSSAVDNNLFPQLALRDTALKNSPHDYQPYTGNMSDINDFALAGNRISFPTFEQNLFTRNMNIPQQYRGDRWYGLYDAPTGNIEYQYRDPGPQGWSEALGAALQLGGFAMGMGGMFGFNPLGDLLGSFGFGDMGGLGSLFGNSGGGWLDSIGNFFGGAGDIGGSAIGSGGIPYEIAWPDSGYLSSTGGLGSGLDMNSIMGIPSDFSIPGLDQYTSGFEDLPFGDSGGMGNSFGGDVKSISDLFNTPEFQNWSSGMTELANTPLPSNPTFDTNLVEGLNANNQFGSYTGGIDPLEAGLGSGYSPSLDLGGYGGPGGTNADYLNEFGTNITSQAPTSAQYAAATGQGSGNILDRIKNMDKKQLMNLGRIASGVFGYGNNMNAGNRMQSLAEEVSRTANPYGPYRAGMANRLESLFTPEGQRASFDEWMRGAGGTMRDQAMARLAATGRRANPAPLTTMLNRGFMSNLNNQQQLLGNLAGAQFNPADAGRLYGTLYGQGIDRQRSALDQLTSAIPSLINLFS